MTHRAPHPDAWPAAQPSKASRSGSEAIAYSEGFSAHPKVSFPDALALGCASTGEYAAATRSLHAAEGAALIRERKGENVRVDLRPYVHDLICYSTSVRVVLHHGEDPVRPSQVHAALSANRPDAAGWRALPHPTLMTRVAQGAPAEDGVREALSGDHISIRASTAS